MADGFRLINADEFKDNPFTLIGNEWMLITAGTPDNFNTMTASWGGMGRLWDRNVCFIFVRPTRYTYEFMEKNETFSLSFFTKEWRDALVLCGSKSGRDIDKAKATGLEPIPGNHNTTGFAQARMIIECRKIYYYDIIPGQILDPAIDKFYPKKDYHRMYIGEILSIGVK